MLIIERGIENANDLGDDNREQMECEICGNEKIDGLE